MLLRLLVGRFGPRAGLSFRWPRPSWWDLVALAIVVLAFAPASEGWEGAKPAAQKSPSLLQAARRVREGTELVDQLGRFEIVGDRTVFVTDGGALRLIALENLGLERITRTLANAPGPLEWKVTGTVTEYRGKNFVLVHRALVKGAGERREQAAF